ncbi:MAG: RraA family protein [Cyanobacteria bacterium]|nr:RraA family protein [Cyanobacteriota bacterium]
MSNVGFRIYTRINRPSAKVVEDFRGLPVAVIGDEMNRLGCMNARIKPLNQVPLLGVAFTVKARAGDNLMLHRALDMAIPGDVIVVDGQGDLSNAISGENMMMWAQRRKLAGVIVDGAMRDRDAIRNMQFAVFAAGIQPKGPYKNGPGEINVPICCGGVVIYPGDIIVGDEDGVVAVRPNDAPAVCKRAHARHQKENLTRQSIVDGTYDRSAYTEDALRKMGCEVIDAAWSEQNAEEKV